MTCASDAWEVVHWYGWRWLLEDFHKALLTGCRIEHHTLQSVEAQWRLVAILTPIAWRLLLIRQAARASARNACDCRGFSRGHPGRDPVGYSPPRSGDG
jgi:hypothetical protein